MPHRVEPYPMSHSQPQPQYYPQPTSKHRHSPYDRRASPPPIATLPTHSGSPSPSASSLDRSAVSTPPAGRRTPPPQAAPGPHHPQHAPHHYPYDMPRGYGAGGYLYAPPPPHAQQQQQQYHPDDPQAPRYDPHAHGHPYPAPYGIQHGGYVPYPLPGTILSAPMPPPAGSQQGQGVIQVVHTDDAATKLSDRVRRRCFNCCTTDTSTWRRSNLSPGKVLCNKCGLFERTHSRPRPEQFPHKRGPLASSSLQSRSPPTAQAQPYPPQQQQQQQPYPASAPPPPQSQPQSASSASQNVSPYIPPLHAPSSQNGNGHASPHASVSHPGTPNPQNSHPHPAANGNNANANGESQRLPGVDSWAPDETKRTGAGDKRAPSPRERDEREERRESGRERSPA
ncbi:hypothetical protein C8R43DRAFT_1007034 [Mycena crocata]|nr:hypothetical protein C8R43DRAFT_1007034 [Mycena crocata]